MIYVDNSATSYPKPKSVLETVINVISNIGGSPGRSAYRTAIELGRIVFETREKIASLFNIKNSNRLIFTSGTTESINTVLFGLLNSGDKVLTTSMEHNSVMRPLRFMEKNCGIKLDIVRCSPEGEIDLDLFSNKLKNNVKLVVINHGSNVIGTIAPLDEICKSVKKYNSLILVDAAQTAGIYPIDVEKIKLDFLACSGHKGLLGPQGTGCLYIRDNISIRPLKFGGTGSNSESDEQPEFLPDRFESGTLNAPGIAGLGAGVSFVLEQGIEKIFEHGTLLVKRFLDGILSNKKIKVYGPKKPDKMLPIISFTIDGYDSAAVAHRLSDEFDICTRVGLHCSPWAHKTIGTFPSGTIRVSFGYSNTTEDVDNILKALNVILNKNKL